MKQKSWVQNHMLYLTFLIKQIINNNNYNINYINTVPSFFVVEMS